MKNVKVGGGRLESGESAYFGEKRRFSAPFLKRMDKGN